MPYVIKLRSFGTLFDVSKKSKNRKLKNFVTNGAKDSKNPKCCVGILLVACRKTISNIDFQSQIIAILMKPNNAEE